MIECVAVLIAGPDAQLTPAMVRTATDLLQTHPRWLRNGVAAEFPLDPDTDPRDADDRLRGLVGPDAIDVAVVPNRNRRKRLLIADMDSTIIMQECIDELAAEVGRRDEIASVTERAMRGEIAFDDALRHRVSALAGLPIEAVDRVLRERIVVRSGANALVQTMKRNGAHTMLVSGGFTLFTGPVAARVGFAEHRANRLNVEEDRFVGTVAEPILGQEAKLIAMNEASATHGLAADDVLAVGDGANDLMMIEAAGLGVALHAKPAVSERADVRLQHADLSALLYLQGYSADEIVEG